LSRASFGSSSSSPQAHRAGGDALLKGYDSATDCRRNRLADDPYGQLLAGYVPDCQKAEIRLTVRVVLSNQVEGRNLRLIDPSTRAIVRGGIVEFIGTRDDSRPGQVVADVAYLCFAEAEQSSVLVAGDRVDFGAFKGRVVGFNEDHSPNHLNVVVRTDILEPGRKRGLTPGQGLVVCDRAYAK
jgi:hypothetical protein